MATVYKKRILDSLLERALSGIGAVVIEGPKGCGKTTTGLQLAKSKLMLGAAETRANAVELLGYNAKAVLAGNTPRMIDEWQTVPRLWDAVRYEIDNRQAVGQFILTGSAVPADRSEIFHTGTGRFAWLTMRTMSLFESGESNGEVSLSELFEGHHDISGQNGADIEHIAFAACRGGWPQCVGNTSEAALDLAYNYVDAVLKTDISRVDGEKKNTYRSRALLRSYARNLGSSVSVQALWSDISSQDDDAFSVRTCQSYLYALREIFVTEDMPAWNPNLRSKTAIRTSDTRYFTDPSVAAAALQIGPQDLLNDPKTFGFLFENLCVRDLRVYADALRGNLFHYRDKNNLECDAVLHRKNGSYGLIEIKLGGKEAIAHGAETLTRLAQKIDTTKMPAPSFLMVLTAAGDFAYRRADGVLVVPLACLKP